jgi:hypothetical protein
LSVDDVMELRAVGVTGPDARAFGPHGDPPPSSAPPHPPDPPHPQHD